jgi:CMP-N-acetylneuraminic acid synthetase
LLYYKKQFIFWGIIRKNRMLAVSSLRFWSFIPVRAGSLRLPQKALRLLGSIPLIDYTLSQVQQLKQDRITTKNWLYTNDTNVLSHVKETYPYGDSMDLPPFARPETVSHATAGAWETVQQFIQQLHASNTVAPEAWATHLVLLQTTSPFRKVNSIINAIDTYQQQIETFALNPNETGLLSVTALEKPSAWLLQQSAPTDALPAQLCGVEAPLPPSLVYPNGAIYIVPIAPLLAETPFQFWQHLTTVLPYTMPWLQSIDIDTAEDLALAEQLYKTVLP